MKKQIFSFLAVAIFILTAIVPAAAAPSDVPAASVQAETPLTDVIKITGPTDPVFQGEIICLTVEADPTGRLDGIEGPIRTAGLEFVSASYALCSEARLILIPAVSASRVTYTYRVTAPRGQVVSFEIYNVTCVVKGDSDVVVSGTGDTWSCRVDLQRKIILTVFPASALNGDIITPDEDAEVNGITASPAGGEWTVSPEPDRGISASSGGVTINASLLPAGTYRLTYTTPIGVTKSVKIVQPAPLPSASPSATSTSSAIPQPSAGAEPSTSAAPSPSASLSAAPTSSSAPQPSSGTEHVPSVIPIPTIPTIAGYGSGYIGGKFYYVKTAGASTMYYLKSSSGKMARVSAPYNVGSGGTRYYPVNYGGAVLFPRMEEGSLNCYCVCAEGLEVPVLNAVSDPEAAMTDVYQTGMMNGRIYYIKTAGASTMYYLKSSSGRMTRVSAPYVTAADGTRYYPINYGGIVLFPGLSDGSLASYNAASSKPVLTVI